MPEYGSQVNGPKPKIWVNLQLGLGLGFQGLGFAGLGFAIKNRRARVQEAPQVQLRQLRNPRAAEPAYMKQR